MGYLNGFKYDIFVSYAHRRLEQSLAVDGKTWTRQVVELLRDFIANDLELPKDQNLSVFQDIYSLERDADLTDALMQAVDETGILVVFVSKDYMRSKWCFQEALRFRSRQRFSDKPNKTGIFLIEVEETEREDWPDSLKDRQGNPQLAEVLHRRADPNARSNTLGFPRVVESQELCDRIADLATHVRRSLEALKAEEKSAEREPAAPAGPSEAPEGLFVGFTASRELRGERQRLVELLAERDIAVLDQPRLKTLGDADGFEQRVRSDLAGARLAVLLMGDVDGRWSLTTRQHALIQQAKMPLLSWRPPDLELDELDDVDEDYDRYHAFAEAHFPEAVPGGIEDLADAIAAKLAELDAARQAAIDTGIFNFSDLRPYDETRPTVLVFSGNREGYRFVRHDLRPTLGKVLDEKGWHYILPGEELDSPARLSRFYRENVEGCDAVILVHCQNERDGVIDAMASAPERQGMVQHSVKMTIDRLATDFRHLNRKHPGEFFVAVVDGPPDGLAIDFGRQVHVFDCSRSQVDQRLYAWLEALRKHFDNRAEGA